MDRMSSNKVDGMVRKPEEKTMKEELKTDSNVIGDLDPVAAATDLVTLIKQRSEPFTTEENPWIQSGNSDDTCCMRFV